MQDLNLFLQTANYKPAFNGGIALVGLTICVIVCIAAMHTLHTFGRRTPLYRKNQPVKGWNKRFYIASSLMIIFLLILMWLLNVWSHSYATPVARDAIHLI